MSRLLKKGKERRKGGREEDISIELLRLKDSTLCLGNVYRHRTAFAELLRMVLFIIFGDGQVPVSVKKTLRLKSQNQSVLD